MSQQFLIFVDPNHTFRTREDRHFKFGVLIDRGECNSVRIDYPLPKRGVLRVTWFL